MVRRIDQLRDLRAGLETGDAAACDRARAVGQALRGSGATFGFPRVSEVAAVLETSQDVDVLRRVEGLISDLLVFGDSSASAYHRPEWLARAAGLTDVTDVVGAADLSGAWAAVGRRVGLDPPELAKRVSDHLSVGLADLSPRSRAAVRLVPEALATGARIVPLHEDSVTITVATADPTAIRTELDLRRLTGRRPVLAVTPPDAIDAMLADLYGDPGGGGGLRVGSGPRARTRVDAGSRGQHVLVVDDDPEMRLLTRAVLEKRGYAVTEAADGVEALEMVRSGEVVELVVADLNMPRMDGLELIWQLREAVRDAHLPVIVVTGAVDEVLEAQLIEEGADDYIRKPIEPRLFLARVEATIRRAGA